ncbi:MAG TPA: helix-turn-helix transcriptional regulator, partial [Terriglobales bacterium]|nr:helix-turn-helix transcriptional regulator [Terriglobales bacterium]
FQAQQGAARRHQRGRRGRQWLRPRGMIAIGARIREMRLARGLSQGDLENRTGLLRCYLSRVENGHTEPSLQTLARIAVALNMPVAGFFDADEEEAPAMDGSEAAFLTRMREFSSTLNEQGRRQVLELARKMAAEIKN